MNDLGLLARLSVPEGFVGLDAKTLPRVEAWAAARGKAGISRRREAVDRDKEVLVPSPTTAGAAPFRPRPSGPAPTSKRPTTWRQLDAEAEHALIKRYQDGDNGAGDILLLAHEPLVLGYAKKFMAAVCDLDGLLQNARSALLAAAAAYEPGHGAAFPTYAIWWIRHAMIRFTEDEEHTIGMPSSVQEIVKRAKRLGATTPEEAFAMTDEPTVFFAWPLLHGGVVPLDVEAEDDEGRVERRFPDPPSPDPSPEALLNERRHLLAYRAIIEEAIGQLQPKWAIVFRRLHLDEDPPTQEALAATLKLSRARVGQIAKAAYEKVERTARRLWAERQREEERRRKDQGVP